MECCCCQGWMGWNWCSRWMEWMAMGRYGDGMGCNDGYTLPTSTPRDFMRKSKNKLLHLIFLLFFGSKEWQKQSKMKMKRKIENSFFYSLNITSIVNFIKGKWWNEKKSFWLLRTTQQFLINFVFVFRFLFIFYFPFLIFPQVKPWILVPLALLHGLACRHICRGCTITKRIRWEINRMDSDPRHNVKMNWLDYAGGWRWSDWGWARTHSNKERRKVKNEELLNTMADNQVSSWLKTNKVDHKKKENFFPF